MGYKQTNILLSAVGFLLLFGMVAFLLYRQDFFVSHDRIVPLAIESPVNNMPTSADPVPVGENQNTEKLLKSFGFCGNPGKNDIILNYPVELLNALLDDVQGNHCEPPKVGYPNYTFLLPDTSLVRLAEMTPDHRYVFYLKVETTVASSTYFLYKIDLVQKQTVVLERTTIANDWPLQKDFYEEDLLPRQTQNGKYLIYNWFIKDPKGESNIHDFLRGKLLDPNTNKVIFVDPSNIFNISFPPAVSENGKNILFQCGRDLCITNFLQVKKIAFPGSTQGAPLSYTYFRFKDDAHIEVGFNGSTLLLPVSTL